MGGRHEQETVHGESDSEREHKLHSSRDLHSVPRSSRNRLWCLQVTCQGQFLKLHHQSRCFFSASVHNTHFTPGETLHCIYFYSITSHRDILWVFYSLPAHSVSPLYSLLLYRKHFGLLLKGGGKNGVREVVKNGAEVPPSALIFCSFGIVIWEILTQQKPFAGRHDFIWNASHPLLIWEALLCRHVVFNTATVVFGLVLKRHKAEGFSLFKK